MNDFTLLRPFDLEAAKRGESLLVTLSGKSFWNYVAGPDITRNICVSSVMDGLLKIVIPEVLRMAPLGWVEDKPVYKGDKLYLVGKDRLEVVKGADVSDWVVTSDGVTRHCSGFTWTKPEPISTLTASEARRIVAAGNAAREGGNTFYNSPYSKGTVEELLFEKGWLHGEY